MTRPEGGRLVKPCKGCGDGKPIYTDGEDFFKWDPERQLYRAVSFKGDFYPIDTHPGCTEVQLVRLYRTNPEMGELKVATEHDILWRTFALVVDVLVANKML
jgi:hypothetical protein